MAAAAPVVIEMPAQDAALPFARVLVNACTEGLRDRRPCVLEDSTTPAAYAVVIVSWESPAHTGAKIEVGMRQGSRADWVTRYVTFNASDVEAERWRSVGLIVATLVEQAGNERKTEPPSAAAAPPGPPEAKAAPPDRSDDSAAPAGERPSPTGAGGTGGTQGWLLDGAFETARGAGSGFGAFGGVVRAGHHLGSLPLFATGSVRYETQATDGPIAHVSLQWAWVSAGVGVAADLQGPFRVEARLEPTAAWVHASAAGSVSSPSGALLGVREGVGATWWWARPIGLVVGVEATQLTQSAVVNVSANGAPPYPMVTTEDWFGWCATAGLRMRLE
jgi:hypothetical protein